MFEKTVRFKGKLYTIVAPSKTASKKYDVYWNDKRVVSFGARGYQQYHDKIGFYKKDDHLDKTRRANYRSRHQHDYIDDPTKAGSWSWHFLW